MELYTIRHPEADIISGICYGRSDIPPAAGYEVQIKALYSSLQPLIKQKKIRIIYSSPLQRCSLPAKLISTYFDLPLKFSDSLQEIDFGRWELKSYDDLWKNSEEYRKWIKNWQTAVIPDGGSLPELKKGLRVFLNKHREENICIVSHAGVIRIIKHLLEKISLENVFAINIPYSSLISINFL